MKRLNADPDFAAAVSERLKRLHADPVFAAKQAAGASKAMKRRHADPEFAASNSERMKRLQTDRKRRDRPEDPAADVFRVQPRCETERPTQDLANARVGDLYR